MTPKQPDDPGPLHEDDRFYSSEPLAPSEWRALRRMLAMADELDAERTELRSMLAAYKLAGKVKRGLWIVGAWMIGAIIIVLGIYNAAKQAGFWPPKGGP